MQLKRVVVGVVIGYGFFLVGMPANASFRSAMEFIKTMQSEASAWSVNVKQTALGANQVSNTIVNAQQNVATANGAIMMTDRLIHTVVDFGADTGQPRSSLCEAQTNSKLFVLAEQQKMLDAKHLMASLSSHSVESQLQADVERQDQHRQLYCSASEAKQGLCRLTPNGMQSWDVNYAGAFSERTLAPEGELAAYAYAGMVADRRIDLHAVCDSAACLAAQGEQLAAAAVTSMVANSFVEQATSRRVPVLTGK